jgi:deoxyribonuclease II
MAPALQSSLLVETWTNGEGHVMPSDCRAPFKVQNVQQVNVTSTAGFSSHLDHSKWAVAYRSQKPWICIGDINRMVCSSFAYRF